MNAEVSLPASEEALVCAVLNDPDALRFAVEHAAPPDFADPRLGALYGLVIGMRSAGLPVDAASVAVEAARRGGPLPDTGHIHSLFSAFGQGALGQAGSASYHAKVIRDAAVGRDMQAVAYRYHQAVGEGGDVAQLAAKFAADVAAIRDGHRPEGLVAPTLAEVLSGPTDYDWVIPGLLERGDRFVLTGGEGAGKTYFMRQMAILACAGIHPTTFTTIDPVDVVVVDAENSERQWRRNTSPLAAKAAHLGQRDPREHLRVACSTRLDITSERHLGAIHRLLDEHNPQVLVIGPLYKLVPFAITNDDHAAPLITALDSLRERGVALLMEAHAGHALTKGGDRDLRPRGSSALLGWPEFGYGLALDRDEENVAHLVRWRGDRDERQWPLKLVRGGHWPWVDYDHRSGASGYPYGVSA